MRGTRLSSRQKITPPAPPRKQPSLGPGQTQERRRGRASLTVAGSSMVGQELDDKGQQAERPDHRSRHGSLEGSTPAVTRQNGQNDHQPRSPSNKWAPEPFDP